MPYDAQRAVRRALRYVRWLGWRASCRWRGATPGGGPFDRVWVESTPVVARRRPLRAGWTVGG